MPDLLPNQRRPLLALIIALIVLLHGAVAAAAAPVAHAVLFYSPTCPHCHVVIDEVLPPLQSRYGEQLAVAMVDVTRPDGQALYRSAITAFAIADDRLGVPTLIMDETVLVGSAEIPAQLPGLIETTLAAGGNRWPAIPGLEAAVGAEATTTPPPALSPFQRDPLANSLALIVLLGMIVSVVAVLFRTQPPFDRPLTGWRRRAVPLLALAGMAVAAYLAFVELSGGAAVCGPLGDCNTVQQSPYARLFGVLPIGVLGVFGFGAVLVAWALQRFGSGPAAHWAGLALPIMAFAGTLFSIYLTFLEPFVIGATCMWCLASALLMTALLWITVPRGPAEVRRGKPTRRVPRGAHQDAI